MVFLSFCRAVGPPEYPKWFCKFEGMADGQAGYYVLPGNALVRHPGSANRSSRSRQSVKYAPETPNAELPRGRLMSDLKAASEPVMGKREGEERSGLEGVRRALFSEGGRKEGEKQTDDSEKVGRMGVEAGGKEGLSRSAEPSRRPRNVTDIPSIPGDACPSAWGDGAPAVSYPLKEEPCTPPRIAGEQQGWETSATKRRRTEGVMVNEADNPVWTPVRLVKNRVNLGPSGVDEGSKRVRCLDELDEAGERDWRWDDVDEGSGRVRSLSELGGGSKVERGKEWQSNGVDQGFKAVRSLTALVSSGVRKGNKKQETGEHSAIEAKRSKKVGEECGPNGGLRAEIALGEGPIAPRDSAKRARPGKGQAKHVKQVKLRELAEVLRRMEFLEHRRRQFEHGDSRNGYEGCENEPEANGGGAEKSCEGGIGFRTGEGGLSRIGIHSDNFGRPSGGPAPHESTIGCGRGKRDTECFSNLHDSWDDEEKYVLSPGVGQSEPAGDNVPIDLRTPERPSKAPNRSQSPFGETFQETVRSPRRDTASKKYKKVAWLLETAGIDGERRPHQTRGDFSDGSDGEWGGLDAEGGRSDAAWRSSDADGGRTGLDAAPDVSETARGSAGLCSDTARGRSDTIPGRSVTARGCLDSPRGTVRGCADAVPGHPDASVGRSDAAQSGSDCFGRETDAESEEQLDSEWVECEACHKWRRLPPGCPRPPEDSPWFCSMNKDPLRQVRRDLLTLASLVSVRFFFSFPCVCSFCVLSGVSLPSTAPHFTISVALFHSFHCLYLSFCRSHVIAGNSMLQNQKHGIPRSMEFPAEPGAVRGGFSVQSYNKKVACSTFYSAH